MCSCLAQVDGEPILIVRYETQQVHCIRNAKGEITEGSESEVFSLFCMIYTHRQQRGVRAARCSFVHGGWHLEA